MLDGTRGGRPGAVVISAIAGTAGVGKTALAVHWAHRVRDRFPDGQLYVNLRGYAPARRCARSRRWPGSCARSASPPSRSRSTWTRRPALYRSLLADRRMLVVLDNARDAEQVRPLLPGSPGCLVLVTSRDRLAGLVARDGAHRLTLDVLDPDEARRAAGPPPRRRPGGRRARRRGRAGRGVRAPAAGAADRRRRPDRRTRAAASPTTSPSCATATGSPRWRSTATTTAAVRAAFDLSYAALAADARRLFRLLGLVPGAGRHRPRRGRARPAPASPRPGRLLDRLAAAHLLDQHAPGRYAFHDLLRAYAAERADAEEAAAERDAAIGRLLEHWYLRTVDAAARLLYPEMLRPALPRSRHRPGDAAAVAFDDHAQAAGVAGRRTAQPGRRHRARRRARAAPGRLAARRRAARLLLAAHATPSTGWPSPTPGSAAAEADGDLHAQAAAHLSLADAHRCQGRYDKAIEHYAARSALAGQAGWLDGRVGRAGQPRHSCTGSSAGSPRPPTTTPGRWR